MTPNTDSTPNPWTHRLAVLLTCATFPVIWVGGLVTTYDAGMSFPDWPTSYGYNVFLYPWQTWLSGPWNMFIEHGHRLLVAGIVGPVTLALVVLIYRSERRRWVRRLTWAAALLVVVQAVLGGMRVVLDQRLLAQIHACVGPAFFALASVLATVTSKRWQNEDFGFSILDFGLSAIQNPKSKIQNAPRLPRLATTTAAIAYIQLLIGSQLRHVQVTADAIVFRIAVWFHLLVALALVVHVALLWLRSCREATGNRWLRVPADALLSLIIVQIALGCGTWVVNYGWPAWMSGYTVAAGYVVHRDSFLQATLTTAHVATGSLILAVAVVLTLRAWRARAAESQASGSQASGVRRQASGNDATCLASTARFAARRGAGAAQFAFCILHFAFCNSRLSNWCHCKLQIAKCKLQIAIGSLTRSAVEEIA